MIPASIDELELPLRIENALKLNGIETIETLIGLSQKEVLRLPLIGPKALVFIEEALAERCLWLDIGVENG